MESAGLIIVFAVFLVVRSIFASMRQRNHGRDAVEEQRRRKEEWEAQHPQEARERLADQREHPWETSAHRQQPVAANRPPAMAQKAEAPICSHGPTAMEQGAAPVSTQTPAAMGRQQARQRQQALQQRQQALRQQQFAQKQAAKAGQSAAVKSPAAAMERNMGQPAASQIFAGGLNRQELVTGIILSEVLGPPLAKRGRRL